jgi:DNA-binding response OmpR family regulator
MLRVMVVEDNADVRLLLGRVLRSAKIAVTAAESGRAALALLDSDARAPDAVLLDVQMPELDGWDTLGRIRAHSDVPVILCTVKGGPTDRARGWRLGCDGYLAKPFDVHDLVAEVHEVVARDARERLAVREAGLAEAASETTVAS